MPFFLLYVAYIHIFLIYIDILVRKHLSSTLKRIFSAFKKNPTHNTTYNYKVSVSE